MLKILTKFEIMKRLKEILNSCRLGEITIAEAKKKIKNFSYECPNCESQNVRAYFVDTDLEELDFSTNSDSLQGKCNDCGYDDEISCFV